MLQVYKLNIFLYASNQEEVDKLEKSLKDFVNRQRERGVAVTAEKLNAMLNKWGNSIGAVL